MDLKYIDFDLFVTTKSIIEKCAKNKVEGLHL